MMASTLNLKEILKEYQEDLEKEFTRIFNDLEKDHFPSSTLLEALRYSVLDGGKRIRPVLSLLTSEAVLASEEKLELKNNPALNIALAIELVHSGSLVHDDLPCMDDDDLRRGKASCHKKFNEATALLAGDFLMSYPVEFFIKRSHALFTKHEDSATINLATLKLNQAINDMIIGQALDMSEEEIPEKEAEKHLKQIQKLKTGALLKASVEIAALLSNASVIQVKSLVNYAEKLGLAFQITDDILDHTQNSEELGKTAGKDQDQDKLTYLKIYGLDKSKEIAENLIKEAKNSLMHINLYTDKLIAVADYVVSRTN